MKKIINFVIVSLIMGLLSINALAFDLSSDFTDSEYGYSIKYPIDWKSEINRSGMVLADINRKDDKAGLQIRITKSNQPMDVYVQNYINKFKKDMQARLISEEYVIIDSKKASKISFKANRRGKDYLLLSYLVQGKKAASIFIFQAGVPFLQRYEIMPVIDAIAGSFELN